MAGKIADKHQMEGKPTKDKGRRVERQKGEKEVWGRKRKYTTHI